MIAKTPDDVKEASTFNNLQKMAKMVKRTAGRLWGLGRSADTGCFENVMALQT